MQNVPIQSVRGNERNPRKLDKEKFQKLVQSIKDFPEMLEKRPLVVADGVILGGNMRHKAAIEAGLKEIPIIDASEWTDKQKEQFIIKDNLSFGEWDWDVLANEWDPVQLEEWGLDVWQPDAEPAEGLTDPDDVPEVPEEPKTKLGDLYILGEHRLLCGDSTKTEDVERLMDGQKADMVFTDPPYALTGGGVNQVWNKDGTGLGANQYVDNTRAKLFEVPEFSNWVPLLKHFLIDDGVVFAMSNVRNLKPLMNALEDSKARIHNILIMDKSGGFPHIWYTCHTEFILYYYYGKAVHPVNKCQPNIFHVKMPKGSEKKHTSQKPVEMIEKIILDHYAQLLFDPFLGSGSTLIAAEKTGRKCYGMELDPKYCDVIVKRWEDFTGKKAERVTKA